VQDGCFFVFDQEEQTVLLDTIFEWSRVFWSRDAGCGEIGLEGRPLGISQIAWIACVHALQCN
jgi:hypothetical protein